MSLISANKVEKNTVEMKIQVGREQFEQAIEQAYRKNIGRITVPGFRKGKAPRRMVERYYGESVFYEDAVGILYPEAYKAAVEEAGIEPVDRADIEVDKIDADGFTFTARVTVKPEVKLGEYKGLIATRKLYTVSDDEVEAELKRLQERNARIVTVTDRPAQLNDTAIIDFEGFVDGEAFAGGKGENHPLKLGSGQFIPGFEDQLVGKSVGETCDVTVTFPEEYHEKSLAGKPAVFKVTIKELKFSELPELDDEFAKDVSEFETLDALKADIREKIQQAKDKSAQNDVENQLIDAIIAGMEVEMPEVLIERQVDGILQEYEYRLSMQGLDFKSYLQYTGMDEDGFRKAFRDQGEKKAKIALALDKIIEMEKIEPTEEELDAEYKRLAEMYNMEADKIKGYLPADEVKRDVCVNKAIDLVKSAAVITEVPAEEAAKATEAEEPAKEEKPKKRATRKKAEKAAEATEETAE